VLILPTQKDAVSNLGRFILLIQDLHVRVVNAITGELLRDLVIDPNRDYQPRHKTT
jgi:hypothetical protein